MIRHSQRRTRPGRSLKNNENHVRRTIVLNGSWKRDGSQSHIMAAWVKGCVVRLASCFRGEGVTAILYADRKTFFLVGRRMSKISIVSLQCSCLPDMPTRLSGRISRISIRLVSGHSHLVWVAGPMAIDPSKPWQITLKKPLVEL